jgi:hypothetical protein
MTPNFTLQALVRRFFPEELAEREEELIKEVLGRINSISKEKAAAEAASSNRGNRAVEEFLESGLVFFLELFASSRDRQESAASFHCAASGGHSSLPFARQPSSVAPCRSVERVLGGRAVRVVGLVGKQPPASYGTLAGLPKVLSLDVLPFSIPL